MVGAGTGTDINNTEQTFTVNGVGGEYSHQLLISEMPEHSHDISMYQTGSEASGYGLQQNGAFGDRILTNGSGWTTKNKGGNESHNNVQPYLVVNMWQRTK